MNLQSFFSKSSRKPGSAPRSMSQLIIDDGGYPTEPHTTIEPEQYIKFKNMSNIIIRGRLAQVPKLSTSGDNTTVEFKVFKPEDWRDRPTGWSSNKDKGIKVQMKLGPHSEATRNAVSALQRGYLVALRGDFADNEMFAESITIVSRDEQGISDN